MITFSDQQAFLQLVRPPAGYKLTACIGTTYSLDLTCVVAMAQATAKNTPSDDSAEPSIYEALQAITEFIQKSAVFFQSCQMKDHEKDRVGLNAKHYGRLISLLDQMLVAVPISHVKATFHPKVWVVKFDAMNGTDEPIYRLLVTSRNLSGQMDWEIGCVMEGAKELQSNGLSTQLSSFFGSFKNEVPKTKSAFYKQLVSDLASVRFQPPPRTRSLQLLFKYGGTKTNRWINPSEYRGLIVVSPFISTDMVASLSEGIRDKKSFYLITLPESSFKLRKLASIHKRCFVFAPGEVNIEGAGDVSMGLHAKMYLGLRSDDTGTDLFLGSANCTTSGLIGSNTEAIVRLRCPAASFTDFLGTFVYQNIKTETPQGWLRRFEELSEKDLEKAEEEAKRKKVLSDARAALATGRFQLIFKPEMKKVILRFLAPRSFSLPERVRIKVSPWDCSNSKDLSACCRSKGGIFDTNTTTPSDFIHVELSYENLKETFMTVASSNLNKRTRNRNVMAAHLRDPGAFFRYLRLVLKMPTQLQSKGYSADGGSNGPHKHKTLTSRFVDTSFLEEVLVNASHNPEVCEQIQNALEATTRRDENLKGFERFWKLFVDAQKEVGVGG
jgi:hypothetical protein